MKSSLAEGVITTHWGWAKYWLNHYSKGLSMHIHLQTEHVLSQSEIASLLHLIVASIQTQEKFVKGDHGTAQTSSAGAE
jgi:hypothetical protein